MTKTQKETYILRSWGSFLKIPVASSTVNSLLFKRLHGKQMKHTKHNKLFVDELICMCLYVYKQ